MTPEASVPLPVLSAVERRVLGVLVEKAKTTPDAYPLSINALVTGCNQKSNRDPVMNLSDLDVEEALVSCQQKGLAIKITGGRVVRWRHALYEAWKVNKVELAVLGELLLRGPQTEGALRGRASRMEPIEDVDALRAVLRPMAERHLIVYLTPEGRRGTVLTHGFHSADELERLRKRAGAGAFAEAEAATEAAPAGRPAAAAGTSNLEAQLAAVQAEVAELRHQVVELHTAFMELKNQWHELQAQRPIESPPG
jgi:uncharacterized protein YceH (UPF0502 family)